MLSKAADGDDLPWACHHGGADPRSSGIIASCGGHGLHVRYASPVYSSVLSKILLVRGGLGYGSTNTLLRVGSRRVVKPFILSYIVVEGVPTVFSNKLWILLRCFRSHILHVMHWL